jgi:hypothetical protein
VFAITGQTPKLASEDFSSKQALRSYGGVDFFKEAYSFANDIDYEESTTDHFKEAVPLQTSFQSFQECTVGQVKIGPLVGELTAWGDASELNLAEVTLHFGDWQDLIQADNKFALWVSGDSEIRMTFAVNDEVVALAIAHTAEPIEAGDVKVRGRCTWQ